MLKLIIATRGSMPKARAEAALWMAMSARPSAPGSGVDGAVAVDDHLVGQAHEKHRRHQAAARLGAQDLQRGADSIRGGVHRAGHQAVHFALLEHHGADRDRVAETLARHLLGPPAMPPQPGQRADVALGYGLGVEHGDAVRQLQPETPGHPATSSGCPSSTLRVMPRSAHATAACMVRGSVPSGSTTHALAARARSTSW